MKLPFVSIIVTTKNEEKSLKVCLESLKKQNYNPRYLEIIVVDNFSTDKTLKIARLYTSKIFSVGPERSAQRNFGVKKAKGKYFLYLDADMSLSFQLIKKAVFFCEKNHLIALYLKEIITGNSLLSKIRNFERDFYSKTVIDAVRFIRKDIFMKVGGFDEKLTGPEDWDLDKRIRQVGQVAFLDHPQAFIYHHENHLNLLKYLQKKKYYSQSFKRYIKKWGKKDPDLKKQFGFTYRYFKVFTENNKWKKILRNPLLFLGVLILKFFLGLIYLISKDEKNYWSF